MSFDKNFQKYRIAMISDFFYPNIGGVENHIFELSQCMLELGHSVIVITHSHQNSATGLCKQGVRYLKNKLKVYYVPLVAFYQQCTFPTIYCSLPIIREILLRDQIQIVHAHSAFSALALESIIHGKTLGLHTVFTDHSLFGFADLSSILTNRLLQWALADADAVICVSHTAKENTVVRAYLDSCNVYVIPNAVHAPLFTPGPVKSPKDSITVVVISRLVYRKGIDLLLAIIPDLCRRYPQLKFIIGGDGPKRLALEEMRENHNLYCRVDLRGSLQHNEVRETLIEGDIFISPSLTEAFCIAIVEAACCGLRVVATNVGGVKEVLPGSMISLCEPSGEALLMKVREVIEVIIEERKSGAENDVWEQHRRVSEFYTWRNVALRTEKVYDNVMVKTPQCGMERLRLLGNSVIGGKIFALVMMVELLLYKLLCFLRPTDQIRYFSR